MQRFAKLYLQLDETTRTNAKVAAMAEYFRQAESLDAAWAIWFLSGNKIRQIIPSKLLRQWAGELAQIPDWLFDETYQWVGDLAETLNLILPPGQGGTPIPLSEWVESYLVPLRSMPEETQKDRILSHWSTIEPNERFVLIKLLTGGLRVGVSRKLVVRAISEASDIPIETLTHRLMGDWSPTADFYRNLLDPDSSDAIASQPYPFCLANPLESAPESLGSVDDYLVEWKWDGIRAQLIKRAGQISIWSRGEERLDGRFPEIESAITGLNDGTVLDGEILGFKDGQILTFQELQRRINRKKVGPKLLAEVPVIFLAFDILEREAVDIRSQSMRERRDMLSAVIQSQGKFDKVSNSASSSQLFNIVASGIGLSPIVNADSWAELAEIRSQSREIQSEGLMIKSLQSSYQMGRTRGVWWKWKVNPYTVDAVLIYAQRGHGKRASLYTDYTFAVWDQEKLVPFAKAYSGLSDQEIRQVDKFIRQNIIEKFGPVRSVKPEIVMELAFENIQISNRHKSGIAVRFPRILRWRTDKRPTDANSLDDVKSLLNAAQEPSQ